MADPTISRDVGLVRGIGVAGLASNVVNYTVGASIFVMPAAAAAAAGTWVPVAFLIAALANAGVTVCFAEASARVPTSGGQAGFTSVAFGPFAGFLAGTLTYFANVLAAGAILAAAADTVAAIAPGAGAPLPRGAMLLGWAALLAFVNLRGVKQAARVVELAAAVKLVPLGLFLVVGAFAVHGGNLPLPRLPAPAGLGDAALLAVFLFAGVHGALLAGGEIRDPARTVPRALAVGLAVVTLVFVGAQLVAQGILGADTLALSMTPLADALGSVSPALRGVMLGGALVSMLGWTVSDSLSTPRALFGLARNGMLPGWLGRVDPSSHVPARAIATHLLLAVVLAIGGSFAAWRSSRRWCSRCCSSAAARPHCACARAASRSPGHRCNCRVWAWRQRWRSARCSGRWRKPVANRPCGCSPSSPRLHCGSWSGDGYRAARRGYCPESGLCACRASDTRACNSRAVCTNARRSATLSR